MESKTHNDDATIFHYTTNDSLLVDHDEILDQLLKDVRRVNFSEKAELKQGETLKRYHYAILVIEELIELATINNFGICKHLEFIYLFNGCYWKHCNHEDLKTFFRLAAEKMGVDRFIAKHFSFVDQLYRQFVTLGCTPKPQKNADSISINLQNGTFDIGKGVNYLRPFDPVDFITYQLSFPYIENATAPLFMAYLDTVLPDLNLQNILSEYAAYIFLPPCTLKLEKVLLLYGTGANGKSVFYEILRCLLGEQNISEYSLQSLTDHSGYYRAMIANKLVNYASEINGKLGTSFFKQLASGEPIEARLPYGNPFTITRYAKLIFNCNELPREVEHTNAYFRRFLIIPFEVTISEAAQDKQLAQKIISAELPGVFNWVLDGLKRLLVQKGFTDSEKVREMRKRYEEESDSVKLFMHEIGYIASDKSTRDLQTVYTEYTMFCKNNGHHPVNSGNMRRRLQGIGIQSARRSKGWFLYISG
jgi:putative DNA primase/helicase